ncbi:hypothetical protein [Paraburkholderia bryophila]|uniref:Uncharacterized protein n=1 Tax=Paraburkholderia bryophila TaxID=420952 RepID=A0A7Y9W4Y6_9BURK|nr:hypothetical protein [Paraburkholderia bryophila]NYH14289.1 hypothetical protein [Paraburkholderia bryophila]
MNSTSFCMRRRAPWVKAGTTYALLVFAIGFALGAIRVLVLVPYPGAIASVVLETPIMLAASWKVLQWSVQRFNLQPDRRSRPLMGIVAFIVLMTAELGVAVSAFGESPAQYVSGIRSIAGGIGFAAQICFAGFPWLQAYRH